MLSVHTILYPTDFSRGAEPAFALACALARDYQARLLILHVAYPTIIAGGEGMVIPVPAQDLGPVWQRLRQIVPDDKTIDVEHLLEEGAAADEILRIAEEKSCDLIVLGTHGRTGLRRLLMGSVAEEIVRRAPCPVLTVKTPLPVHEGEIEASHAEAVAS